jgi:hypothetical protein
MRCIEGVEEQVSAEAGPVVVIINIVASGVVW